MHTAKVVKDDWFATKKWFIVLGDGFTVNTVGFKTKKAAVAVVEFHVLMTLGTAAIDDVFGLDAAENAVELGVRDMESVVMVLALTCVVEVGRQPVVHSDRREMPAWPIVVESEYVSEEPRGFILVVRRNDGVIQLDGHVHPCWGDPEFTKGVRLPTCSALISPSEQILA